MGYFCESFFTMHNVVYTIQPSFIQPLKSNLILKWNHNIQVQRQEQYLCRRDEPKTTVDLRMLNVKVESNNRSAVSIK